MRAVIQRITSARVVIEGKTIGEVGKGLLVFLGIKSGDDETAVSYLVDKIINLRIFEDEQGLMNKSILDIEGHILLISQFTLFAQTKKGNRPSFIRAAKPNTAKPLYEEMAKLLSHLISKDVQLGIFGADMKIDLLNDGPVTIIMDTKDKNNF